MSSQTRCLGCPPAVPLPAAAAGAKRSLSLFGRSISTVPRETGCVGRPVPKGADGFGCKWHLTVEPGERWLPGCVLSSYLPVGKKVFFQLPELHSVGCHCQLPGKKTCFSVMLF